MNRKIHNPKLQKRIRRKMRIRNKILGTAAKPRISVYKSNKHFFIQVIDDEGNNTICSASTYDKSLGLKKKNIESVKKVAENLAEKMHEKKITQAVFDRNGFIYHGSVAAIADTLREKKIKI